MKTDDVIVKDSDIEGKGVFALRDFREGEIVLRWDTSRTLSKSLIEKLNDEEKKYISFIEGKYVVMQEPEKYVNHSCEPNTTAKNFCDVATRDIKEGEEITGDYTEELPPDTYIECNCKSKKCRKIIRRY